MGSLMVLSASDPELVSICVKYYSKLLTFDLLGTTSESLQCFARILSENRIGLEVISQDSSSSLYCLLDDLHLPFRTAQDRPSTDSPRAQSLLPALLHRAFLE